jgi:hypothetical protein
MMQTKMLEVRDRMTYIPVLAIKMVPDNAIHHYYLRRHGYSPTSCIIAVMKIGEVEAHTDPYAWSNGGCRTMTTAHEYIQSHYDELRDGDVVDSEFILGESQEPKTPERLDDGGPWR